MRYEPWKQALEIQQHDEAAQALKPSRINLIKRSEDGTFDFFHHGSESNEMEKK